MFTFALLSSPFESSAFKCDPGYAGIPTSSGFASLLTWTLPSGVRISTFFSWPFFSFCTFMLQPPRSAINITETSNSVVRMQRSSIRNLRRTLHSRAALGNVRNGDRQMPANGNLAEQTLHGRNFRNRRVGKRTHVVFNLGEICRQIWISYRYHCGLRRRMIQQLL